MTYTGNVTSGGPPDLRELPQLRIRKTSIGTLANNVYLLTCVTTGAQLLIDAADEPAKILALVDEGGGGLDVIATTHQHWDHHRALAEVVAATGAAVVAGEPDAAAITEQTGVAVDRTVTQGDRIAVGTCDLTVIALAGHTPGSIALFWEDESGQGHLFTGDSLFPGGVGSTFGDAAAFETLIDEVSTKIFDAYADAVWFYPGHGGDSTLGAQRPHLGEWRARGW